MGVTHVIRGDDHLVNAFRQYHLFKNAGFDVPEFAHIPLIHGPDGAKLSKRHGALGVEQYREMGYLPETLKNYLLRLGWSHGDEEIISEEQAINWFGLASVGRSPSRMDFQRLESLNAHYLREADPSDLATRVAAALGTLEADIVARLTAGMPGLTQRATTIPDLTEKARFYAEPPVFPLENPKAAKLMSGDGPSLAKELATTVLTDLDPWDGETIHNALGSFAEAKGLGFGKIAQPIRGALTGSNASPDLMEVMQILGRDECISRINAVPVES